MKAFFAHLNAFVFWGSAVFFAVSFFSEWFTVTGRVFFGLLMLYALVNFWRTAKDM